MIANLGATAARPAVRVTDPATNPAWTSMINRLHVVGKVAAPAARSALEEPLQRLLEGRHADLLQPFDGRTEVAFGENAAREPHLGRLAQA